MTRTSVWAVLAAAGTAALAGTATADFTVTATGPIDSTAAAGNAANGVILAPYGGSNTIFGTLDFSGSLTKVQSATYASEARWAISNSGYAYSMTFQPTTITDYTGTIAVSQSFNNLIWANTGNNFRFEAFESFDDGAGADSRWNDVNFTLRDRGAINLGNQSSTVDIDTFGSSFDTELALYDAAGTLIANNDDSGAGLQSRITPAALANGLYYLVAGGYDSQFVSGAALPGTATGNLTVQINGSTVHTGTLAASTFEVFTFTVPAPGSLALLGLAGLVARRRRTA
jgi:MYXO-CTERM domain-containing protein